jgi:hypothetical protein
LPGSPLHPFPMRSTTSGGVDFVATPRLTLIGDVVGRTLRGAGRLDLVSKDFEYAQPFSPGHECAGIRGVRCTSASFDEFAPRSADLRLLLGTIGVKFNPAGNLLISASVLFPLTEAGLRSRIATTIGVDYAF